LYKTAAFIRDRLFRYADTIPYGDAGSWNPERIENEHPRISPNRRTGKKLGITTRTIRYYEEIGVLGKSNRLIGGTRTYTRDDILRLKFILKLKDMGISLKEIQELSNIFDINAQNFNTITPS